MSPRLIPLPPMEKSELVRLIEEPILRAYKRPRTNSESTPKIITSTSTGTESEKVRSSSNSASCSSSLPEVPLSEAQRDRRTVFVQQLSVKCTDRDLHAFFTESGCPTRNARIVLDKYTRRSKGVAYVEFYEEDTVKAALKLTGKKLVGVPVIVELTETEKNRIAQEAASLNASSTASSAATTASSSASKPLAPVDDLVRLYVGSLHPSLSESELHQLFEPFGPVESVELLKDERSGASKGVAFVQYRRPGGARMALEALNGFELAGRAIRVGPVRVDKSKLTSSSSSSSSSKSSEIPEQKQDDEYEEEEIILDAKKRAELMQKLLSSRK